MDSLLELQKGQDKDMIIAFYSSQNETADWDVLNLVYTISISRKPHLNSSGYHEVVSDFLLGKPNWEFIIFLV